MNTLAKDFKEFKKEMIEFKHNTERKFDKMDQFQKDTNKNFSKLKHLMKD